MTDKKTLLHPEITDVEENTDIGTTANSTQKEILLRSILDHAPIGIWLRKENGRLGFINKTFCDALGIPEERFLAMTDYAELLEERTAASCKRSDIEALECRGPHISVEEVLCADKKRHWLEIIKVRLPDENNQPTGRIIALSTDITARRHADHRLKIFEAAFRQAQEGMTLTDANANIVEVNPKFSEITGYSREEALGQNPRILQSGLHEQEYYKQMWEALNDFGTWRGEIWNRKKDGTIYPEILSISRIDFEDSDEIYYIAVFTDITELKRQEARLEHLAYHDALTRLPNRTLFSDRLDTAIARIRRNGGMLIVCYLDIDKFKQINDRFGHAFGDNVIIAVSERLSACLRAHDGAARLGGDEFVFLLSDLDSNAAATHAVDRILSSIAETITIDSRQISVTASVGIAICQQDTVNENASDTDSLIRCADQAMYWAKKAGRNCYVFYDPSHDIRVGESKKNLSTIRDAIARGEMRLFYQPKIDMRQNRVIGAEALIRWQHPALGLLGPNRFLKNIANSLVDIQLGEWVVNEALHQLTRWHEMGLNLCVSVNISPFHLSQKNFISRLRSSLEDYPSLPTQSLEIEILETAALEDISHISSLIAECQSIGVSFALDDFGTGYSSLSYLRRLPVNTVKIDQNFVRGMLIDPNDKAIVEGVIGLAKVFEKIVVAEGVETLDHGKMLLELGCDLAQGYGFGMPMAADQFEQWVKNSSMHLGS